jgi:UDP:flavonoid glycosyltransferase YjiC (YdhE family)
MLSIGTTGDVKPMVLLGEELARRGHIVQIAAFKPLGDMIRKAGLEFYCLPGDVYRYIGELIKPGASPVTFLSRLTKSLRQMIEPLIGALLDASRGADVLALTYFGSIGYSIAEKLRIPCFQIHFYPMDRNGDIPLAIMPMLRLGRAYNNLTYSLAYLAVGSLEYHYLRRWRTVNGVSARRIRPHPDYTVGLWRIPVLYAISPQILPPSTCWPSNIHMVGFFQPKAAEEYTPSPSLHAFLSNGSTPIYIGFGSMISGDMCEAMRIILACLKRADLRAVMFRGWGELCDERTASAVRASERVFFADYIPHSWLFEHVRAVVHHGGAGTTAAGLYAGLPTLVIPFGGDQPFWGQQIYRRGLGPKPIPRDKMSEHKLARALSQLVGNPAFRENAQYISKHLRMEDGAATAADIIEQETTAFSAALTDARLKRRNWMTRNFVEE